MAMKSLIFLCLICTHICFPCSYSKSVEYDDDVVVLNEFNFTEFICRNKFVMVVLYAPWCQYSQALAPEYAAAAGELKEEAVVLAKVDATVEGGLAHKLHVQGYPTIYFFINGTPHKTYYGQRTKENIVFWVKKEIVRNLKNITTMEEAGDIFLEEDKILLGYLDSLVGQESEELAAAASMVEDDDVSFYQTTNPGVASLFNVDPHSKRPYLVLIKNEAKHLHKFSGEFTKTAITKFVYENKFTLTNLAPESAPKMFDNPIKKEMIPANSIFEKHQSFSGKW